MSTGNPLLSVRIPPELNELIEQQRQATGESRSDVAIAALTQYLKPPEPEDEISELKQRLQQIEVAVKSMQRAKAS